MRTASKWTVIILAAAILGGASARAGTWSGEGGDDNVSTGANWEGGDAPATTAADIIFTGETRLTPVNDGHFTSLLSITFDEDAESFLFSSPTPITMTGPGGWNPSSGGIQNQSGKVQEISADLALNYTSSTDQNRAVIVSADSTTILSGDISGDGGLWLSGGGTVVLSGNNSMGGQQVRLGDALLRLEHDNALGSVSRLVPINANARLDNTSGGLLSTDRQVQMRNNLTFIGSNDLSVGELEVRGGSRTLTVEASTLSVRRLNRDDPNEHLNKAGAGTLVIREAAHSSWSEEVRINAGTVMAEVNTAFGAGTIVLQGGSLGVTTDLTGIVDALTNETRLNGNSGITGEHSLQIHGTFSNRGDHTLTNAITAAGKTFTLSGDVFLSNTTDGRTLTLAGPGRTIISGVIADSSAEDPADASGLTIAGPGVVELNTENTYTGATTVEAGTLRLGAAGAIASDTVVFGVRNADAGVMEIENENFAFGGTLNLLLADVTTADQSWALFAGSEFGSGMLTLTAVTTDLAELNFTASGDVWSGNDGERDWTFDSTTGMLTVIPEPHTIGLLLSAAALLALRRRRG